MRPFNVDACHSFARGVNKISFPRFVCSANIEGAMLRKYLFKMECVCDVFALCSAFHISIKLILTRVVRSKINIRILNAGHLGNAIALSTQTVNIISPSSSIEGMACSRNRSRE